MTPTPAVPRTPVVGRILGALLVLVAGLGASTAPAVAAAAPAPPRVVVSLTFDDGFADQMAAGALLDRLGLHATFYVNSANIDTPGRLTAADLTALAAAGHEIGGHTVDHAQLTGEAHDEQLREICNDRVALTKLGLNVSDFAYPFGASDTSAREAVRECGYATARSTGGLDPTAPGCSGCAWAESLPARDPFSLRAAPSVVTSTRLQDIEGRILQAGRHGGGWVPLVFHNVCAECGDMAITPSDLTSLGRWLVAQRAAGLVDVRTVAQVVAGTPGPVVAGPPAAPRPGLLVNPSLEQEAVDETRSTGDGSPYCWERASYGTSSATWSRTSDSHSGSWAQEVTVTSMTSGDVKLMSRRDTGACSPTVVPGETYALSAWYRSTAPTRFVVYYGDDRGHWTYWTSSPEQSPSTSWTQAEWALPDLPSGATRVAFGLALAMPGHLVVDDFGLGTEGSLVATTAAAGETRSRSVLALTPVLGLLVVGAGVVTYRRRVAPASSRGRHGASVGPIASR